MDGDRARGQEARTDPAARWRRESAKTYATSGEGNATIDASSSVHESRASGGVCKIPGAVRRRGMPPLTLLTRSVSRPAVVTALLLLSSACSTYRSTLSRAPVADAVAARDVSDQTTVSQDNAAAQAGQGIGRLLIRKASMLLEVENPEVVARRVATMTASLGGYIEQSRESSGGGVHIKVRVPAGMLEEAMDSVATMGRVEKRQISADDVTEQVVDLGARIATRRVIRDRLRALLERASSIEDVITVERELARVQGELDVLERRLEYLRGSSAMAELSVDARRKRVLGPLGLVAVGLGWLVEKAFIIR
jgi:hypothetical protein